VNVRTKVPTSTEQVVEQVAAAAPSQPIVLRQPEPPPAKAYPPKIAKAIIAITRALAPVKKAGVNDFHKYQYPKWESVLDELSPKIVEHGLIIQMDEISHAGFQEGKMIEATYEFTIINDDGDFWPDKPRITQMCKVVDNKGQIDDKAASKVHTQAQKYFLMQLFKVRVRDMEQDDLDYDPGKHRLARKRPVPTASGKIGPHLLNTKEGDTAKSWSARFIEHFNKAESEAECDQWDKLNDTLLTALADRAPDTFNALVDAMTSKLASFKKPAAEPAKPVEKRDPISSGPFPKKPTRADLSESDRDWIEGLDGAFSGCEDTESLGLAQDRYMTPHKQTVAPVAWELATDILEKHLARISGDE
jgi:hypothetical protein